MQKTERQETILRLIRQKHIEKQETLTAILEKGGFSVTQPSVSRDLDELGIVKIGGFYALPQKNGEADFGLINLETAGANLIVAKCESGLASAVCVRIDRDRIKEVVGTIAGDDTIFVAVKDAKSQKAVIKKIWKLFEK